MKIDCDCKQRRPHGHYHGYNFHKCRCEPCRGAYRTYAKLLEYHRERGQGQRIDPGPVRDRILLLKQRGMTDMDIARAAGFNKNTISPLLRKEVRYSRRSTLERLMTIPLPPVDKFAAKKVS